MGRAAKLKDTMPAAAAMLEKIAGGIAVEGMESLAPALVDAMVPLRLPVPGRLGGRGAGTGKGPRPRARPRIHQ